MTIYSITQTFQQWILPPGVNILLGLMGLVLWRWRLIGKILFLISFFSLWLFSTPYVAYQLINFLQNQYSPLELKSDLWKVNLENKSSKAVIFVLGGGGTLKFYRKKYSEEEANTNRIKYGNFLHQQIKTPLIISDKYVSTNANQNILQEDFYAHMQLNKNKYLNTAGEAELLAPILNQRGIKKIYLITNAWHMPRSVYIFKKTGLEVIPAPMGYINKKKYFSKINNFSPSVDALYLSAVAMHEYIGMIWYYLYY